MKTGTPVRIDKRSIHFEDMEQQDGENGYYQFSSITPFKDTNFGIGAATSYNEYFIGTLKNIRYYDRVLTQEEIVRNRNADAVRYFGALGVTNVVVAVAENETYICDPAPGAYFVEGSYTFTAADAGEGVPTGYKLQTWDEANGRWGAASYDEGTSYTYNVSNPSAKVKLTWCKPQPFVLIVR